METCVRPLLAFGRLQLVPCLRCEYGECTERLSLDEEEEGGGVKEKWPRTQQQAPKLEYSQNKKLKQSRKSAEKKIRVQTHESGRARQMRNKEKQEVWKMRQTGLYILLRLQGR